MRSATDVLGVVLAGGAGMRVGGSDKGLQPLCGRPLAEHALQRLRRQCDRVLIIANRNLDRYAAYAPVVHDQGGGHAGPLAGLVAAFGFLRANEHALPDWLLTVPVDCPAPPGDLAARLRAALDGPGHAQCAFARASGVPQPLFALYRIGAAPDRWLASAEAALEAHASPRRWHADVAAAAVDFDGGAAAFHNLNTPEDFAEYERAHAGT